MEKATRTRRSPTQSRVAMPRCRGWEKNRVFRYVEEIAEHLLPVDNKFMGAPQVLIPNLSELKRSQGCHQVERARVIVFITVARGLQIAEKRHTGKGERGR